MGRHIEPKAIDGDRGHGATDETFVTTHWIVPKPLTVPLTIPFQLPSTYHSGDWVTATRWLQLHPSQQLLGGGERLC